MKFTKRNSINEIINEMKNTLAEKYFLLFFPKIMIETASKELWDSALDEVEKCVKMPWGVPFLSEDMVRLANLAEEIAAHSIYHFIPLWDSETDAFVPDAECSDKKSVFLITSSTRAARKRPAVIICPGGGYETLSVDHEGIEMAERMEKAGYCSFVLNYRLKPNQYPEPQKDLLLAIKYVRANAEYYQIDPEKLLLIGSSAGGHLCASTAAFYEEIEKELMADLEEEQPILADQYRGISVRPGQLCLNYPVISFMKEIHEGSFLALTGGREELREKLSVELQVDSSYPKTFVWACEDDGLVPVSNAKRMGEALKNAGVSHMLKVYPDGDHGCGLAYGTSAEGWMEEMLEFMGDQQK